MAGTGDRTRREFARKAALVGAGGLVSTGAIAYGSRSTLAVEALEWTVSGAEISSDDGSVSALRFGDVGAGGDAIRTSYEGVNDPPTDVEFEVRLRGTDAGDGGWSGGADETDWEPLAAGRVAVERTAAEETYSWADVFGEPQPVDVADHSEIALADFEAPDGGTTTEQVLAVELEAAIPDEAVAAAARETATVSVTNPTSTVLIGFEEGQFDAASGADETAFMTDGTTTPEPVDIDVAAFDSARATLAGAGGADGDRAGGAGGRIVADVDLSAVDTLRAWAAEGPAGRTGGWGGFNGGSGGWRNAGGGAGSSHVAAGATVSESVLVADGGGGSGDGGGLFTSGHGGGGGARGGSGGSGSLLGSDGQRGGGRGAGGAGGYAPSIGTGRSGGAGGQAANPGSVDLSVVSTERGGGNAGHAAITLELIG